MQLLVNVGGLQDTKSSVTTASSIESMMQGILVSDLPQTLQDVANVTKALGLRYLWTDCLCIVQDIVEDWAAVLISMDAIYRNATIAIAASSSKAIGAGFPITV
jgi:hypothetical protein